MVPAPDPHPERVVFDDPRHPGKPAGVIGFYFPGYEEEWDRLCGSGFLGNFYDMSPYRLQLEATDVHGNQSMHDFTNAEAAFQALKFWDQALDFEHLSGEGAFQRKRAFAGNEDFSYGGYGSNWRGMQAVLAGKFARGTPLEHALLQTGDAFLLEHNSSLGRDRIWSDNGDGEGRNWLGLQLMLLRDHLGGKGDWTRYIQRLVDVESGKAHDEQAADVWQEGVRSARRALVEALQARPAEAPPGDLRGYDRTGPDPHVTFDGEPDGRTRGHAAEPPPSADALDRLAPQRPPDALSAAGGGLFGGFVAMAAAPLGRFVDEEVVPSPPMAAHTLRDRGVEPTVAFASQAPQDWHQPAQGVLPAAGEHRTSRIIFEDPRSVGTAARGIVGITAFSCKGMGELWDKLCNSAFLDNDHDVGPPGLRLRVLKPGFCFCECTPESKLFRNAEAAFQALKFWRRGQAAEFENLSGPEARLRSKELGGGRSRQDETYAGLGSEWAAMHFVLKAKFSRGSRMAEALLRTKPDFLLQHPSEEGDVKNWLGLQLMLIRDMLLADSDDLVFSGAVATAEWTAFIDRCVDVHTGRSRGIAGDRAWQDAVRGAGEAVRKEFSVGGRSCVGGARDLMSGKKLVELIDCGRGACAVQ